MIEIEFLKQQIISLLENQTLLKEQNIFLSEENRQLKERIFELERRLGLDSTNSSKPPSSDGLRKKPTPQSLRPKGLNKSGGQIGHKGTTLLQTESPDFTREHVVHRCDSCGASLSDVTPHRHIKRQVFDIPLPLVERIEHRAQVKICVCGHETSAPFPTGVTAPIQYGLRVKAMAIYLNTQHFIPEDRLQNIFEDLFDLPIATSTLANIQQSFGKTVAPLQEAILQGIKQAPVKNMDESGLRVAAKTHWLHVISTPSATHYRVSPKRGDLLSDLKGVAVHDHWKPYFKLKDVSHALCNAHHLRELKALEEIEKEPWAFKMGRLLRVANNLKVPKISRIQTLYDHIVTEGLAFHEKQPSLSKRKNKRRPGHNLLIRLRDFKECVLRFLTTQSVPFTNNQAEQDIRMIKVKQKISGGFRTLEGAELFCIIRGFISTARKQGKNLLSEIATALNQTLHVA